jgi:GMP synthase (glutamine-hydrolysing)
MILIIDMNWKKESLAFDEFVSPIVSVIEPLEECRVKHFLEITPRDLIDSGKVVLSGTALQDHATLKQADKFNWIKSFDKPILGVCAGMQTIGLVFDEPLTPCLQIGIADVCTLEDNPLFQGTFKAYTLHNYTIQPSQNFYALAESTKCTQAIKHKQKNIYSVLFHPEVRNQEILKRFTELKS